MADPTQGQPSASGAATIRSPLWRNLFDWDGLNAKELPDSWPLLGQDIVPTLAILMASGQLSPKLLRADDAGNLLTAWAGGAVESIIAPSTKGVGVVHVADSTPWKSGAGLVVIGGQVGGNLGERLFLGPINGIDGNDLLVPVTQVAFQSGDVAVATPLLSSDPIDRSNRRIGTPTGKAPLVWVPSGPQVSGQLASISIAGISGFPDIVIDTIIADICQFSGAALVSHVTVVDTTTSELLWQRYLGCTATPGDRDHFELDNLGVDVGSGDDVTIAFDVAHPGVFESLCVGYYFDGS